ncbi:DUF1212-domain-containing protein [Leucogyrophana mollusca]|uniref:DUF1212-domain-containing protein n=1 Tax=Leucogyrophana mollusca TaxID=85980 RepID=A0ACB8B1X6_9AGAM|nr:DUF1212-domain-containing protein [Leucogyrophana mollusca]
MPPPPYRSPQPTPRSPQPTYRSPQPAHRALTMPISIMTSRDPNNRSSTMSTRETPPFVDDGRPPGGTARSAGARTPRRVQWASSGDVHVNSHPLATDVNVDPLANDVHVHPAESTHALDELALDPNAFETLKDALERHRSSSTSPNPIQVTQHTSLPPLTIPPAAVQRNGSTSRARPTTIPNFPPPAIISAPPPTNATQQVQNPFVSTHSSPTSPSHITPISPTRTITSPTPTTATTSPTSSSPFLPVPAATHNVPGENYIDPNERAGLPRSVGGGNPFEDGGEGAGLGRLGTVLRRNGTKGRGQGQGGGKDAEREREKHSEAYAAHEAGRVVRSHTVRRWGWLYRPKSQDPSARDKDREREKRREKRRARQASGSEWETADEKEKREDGPSSKLNTTHAPAKPKTKHSWHAWHRPYSHSHSPHTPSTYTNSPDSDYDPEAAPSSAPPPPTGVLSALLALYGHEHHEEGSISGASTPARLSLSGDGGGVGDDSGDELGAPERPWIARERGGRDKDRKGGKDKKSKSKSNKGTSESEGEKEGRTIGRTLKAGSESASSLLSSLIPAHHTRSLPLPSIPHPSLPHPSLPHPSINLNLPHLTHSSGSRPPKSTSSAGVLGPLIASAGSLGGAAAPTQSTLAPNLTRPGYGLVRYSMDEVPRVQDGPSEAGNAQGRAAHAQTPHSHGHGAHHPHAPPTVHHPPRRVRSTQFDFAHEKLEEVSPEREREHDHAHEDEAKTESPDTLGASTSLVDASNKSSPVTTSASPATTNASPATIIASPIITDASNKSSPADTLGGLKPGARAPGVATPGGGRKRWSGVLRDLPHPSAHFKGFSLSLPGTPYGAAKSGTGSTKGTPYSSTGELVGTGGSGVGEMGENLKKDYFDLKWLERKQDEDREKERKERKEREREKEKEKRRKRKKAEVYITRHVAAILQRQEFILKLARAMMMFGGPSHRLTAQIQSTARVLDVELSCMYLPDVMLISFEDSATGTSNVKFIRQGSVLDLGKLSDAHGLYWDVIHDRMSVSAASTSLDELMRKKPLYTLPQLIVIGGMCSASICSVSFAGSFIDCLISAPLGALLVAVQLLSVRNELYGNVFEITIATLLSFLSAALASSHHFCYSAVASSSVVLILPGFIVLCGSLELSSRSLVAGAVRLCFALMYSLFLGFGLAIGAELYQKMLGETVIGATDYTCRDSHDPAGPWWQRTPSLYWAFLTVPMYSLFLSLRNQAPYDRKEMLLLVVISSIGWVTNHFTSIKFPNQSDISAAVGAFAVGFVSNMYGRFFNGNAFVVMITGILFQLPSGLGNGGLLNFVSDQTSGSASSYSSGFQTALQLISVSIGLTVGLGISLVVVHPVQSRRRAGGLFSL